MLFQKLKEVLYRLNIIKGAKTVWEDKTLPDYENYYSYIENWKQIYQGQPSWLKLHTRRGERTMSQLRAAKVLCKELSALTFSEQVEISTSDNRCSAFVQRILQENGFWKNLPAWLERCYAIGGGALSTYLDNGQIRIDYVDGDQFAPVGWDNRRINDGVFISRQSKGGNYFTLLRREIITVRGVEIENILYESKNASEIGIKVSLDRLYPGLEETPMVEHCETPLFAYFKPNVVNYIDTDSPLGISVFAHVTDTLKALDIAFDSFSREFILGRKRIIVPTQAMRAVTDTQTGKTVRYFDSNDEAYEAFNFGDAENLKITDNTVTLRIEEHVAAINALLNILCFQTGLSAGTLSFDASGGVKTATEVVSENSKTYRTKRDHQNLLREAIEELIDAIIILGVATGRIPQADYDITIGFNDNVIVDDNTVIDNNIKLTSAGLKSKLKAIMEVQKCAEKEALEELERIKSEESISGTPDDWFGGEGDVDDGGTDQTIDTADS